MKKKKAFYIMTIPAVLLFFIFHTLSLLEGVFYSFTNSKGYGDWSFVGLKTILQYFKIAMLCMRTFLLSNLQL